MMTDRCPHDGYEAEERIRKDGEVLICRCHKGHIWSPDGIYDVAEISRSIAFFGNFFGVIPAKN